MYPGRDVEVLNVAGNTYASYRAKVVFDEIVEHEPDLILIYSGNNEFLEDLVYAKRQLGAPWNASALARFVHRRLTARGPKPVVDVENYGQADRVSTRLSFAFGHGTRMREDPEQLEQVVAHYRYNVTSMVREATQRGIPVMLVDVSVNLKDWAPNVSVHRTRLGAEERTRFTSQLWAAIQALDAGQHASAAESLRAALEIDDAYAEAHYLLGRALQAGRDLAGARAAYLAALETDAYPFRSLPRFGAVRREVAERYGAPLIEAQALLDAAAQDGIAGLDVLVDYVHPTVASNELIAHEVLRAMDAAGLLPEPRALPVEACRIQTSRQAEETVPVLIGLHGQYLIMRQYDHLGAIAARLIAATERAAGQGPEYARASAAILQRTRSIQATVEPYRRLLRAEKLGTLEAEFTREEAQAIHAAYVEMIRQLEAGEMDASEFERFVEPLRYGEG